MDVVETAVGEDGDHVAAPAGAGKRVEDGVGVGAGLGLQPAGAQVPGQPGGGELLVRRDRVQRHVRTDENPVGVAEHPGIVLLEHRPPAGIGARLEHHHQAAVRPGQAQGLQGLPHRGRVVGEVVDHGHPADHAAHLLPPLDPLERAQAGGDGSERKTQPGEQGDHRQRVQGVVVAGHGQAAAALELAAAEHRELAGQAARFEVVVAPLTAVARAVADHGAAGLPGQFGHHRVVQVGDQGAPHRDAADELGKRPLDGGQVGEDVGVVEFDGGENGRVRPVVLELGHLVEEGGVVLVALDHEVGAVADVEIAAKGLDQAADHEARGGAHAVQGGGEQGGGGGLAVGAGDHQRGLVRQEEMAERLRHGQVGQAEAGQFHGLRVGGADHVADDHQVGPAGQVGGRVTGQHRDGETGEEVGHGRVDVLVRAGDRIPPGLEHAGQGGHAGAADADQVDMAGIGRGRVQGRVEACGAHVPRTARSTAR